jgi:hypothetical protein
VDEGLVKIEEDCLKVGIFLGKLVVFARVRNFDAFSEAQYLDLLIKMLPVQVHQIGRLMLA